MYFNISDIKTYNIDESYKQCFSNIKNSVEYSLAIDYMLERFDKNIGIEVTDSAKEVMAKEGYDPVYGARPLKRYISNTLETIIAKKMIAGEIYSGCNIIIDGEDDNIKVEVK